MTGKPDVPGGTDSTEWCMLYSTPIGVLLFFFFVVLVDQRMKAGFEFASESVTCVAWWRCCLTASNLVLGLHALARTKRHWTHGGDVRIDLNSGADGDFAELCGGKISFFSKWHAFSNRNALLCQELIPALRTFNPATAHQRSCQRVDCSNRAGFTAC